jgi:hypothetical protein
MNEQSNVEKLIRDRDRKVAQVPTKYRRIYLNVLNGHGGYRNKLVVNCMECVGWDKSGVEECTSMSCPWFRDRPYKKKGNDLPKIGEKTVGVKPKGLGFKKGRLSCAETHASEN